MKISYKLFYSEEDKEWVAISDQFPYLSFLHKDKYKALKGFEKLLKECKEEFPDNPLVNFEETDL